MNQACPTCHGDGEIAYNDSRDPQNADYARCPDCHGTGIARAAHTNWPQLLAHIASPVKELL
jgi:DnaJ-class molecular chaperone